MENIPEGFSPLFRTSPFLDLIGPIYQMKTDDGLVLGLWAQEKHCNARKKLHGGVLCTLADVALGYNLAFSGDEPLPIVTASLTIDYVGSVKLGDWLEVHVDIQKIGRSLAFANAYFWVDGKRVSRASGTFSISK